MKMQYLHEMHGLPRADSDIWLKRENALIKLQAPPPILIIASERDER